MLETYISPLLMSYVDKYIKNLKPSDLSLSIWGGDVVLYNLELRLDVLEKELKLPITFLSGKIHKLQIHVPWTKLLSEPVNITINTIECVIELKDPTVKHDDGDNASPLSTLEVKKELDKKNLHDRGEPPPAGYVQNLVNRVVNNISICIHNVVLKYVEDDIVLSLNVKSAETFSVNANWEKAFVDIAAPDYILRKVCNISDLTVCLDKISTSGKIDMYQDPLLYKCGLSCRININYDAQLRPKSTKLNVYCESFDLSLTDEQLPLFVRLLKLCVLLYYNTLDLPGCEYKQHSAAKMIKDNHDSQRGKTIISNSESRTNEGNAVQLHQSFSVPQDDWYNWMWSFIPESTTDEALEDTKTQTSDLFLMFGIYISQVTLTLKLTSKVSERTFFGAQRYQFQPLLSCELSGVASELILRGEEFFDAQVGVTSIMGWTLGDCSCYHSNKTETVQSIQETEEDDEKEDMFLSVRAPHDSATQPQGFLLGSLFHSEQTSLEPPEIVFDKETFLEQHSESFALERYGAFFFDYLYVMDIEPVKDGDGEEEEHSGLDHVRKIRLVMEMSHKRMFLGSLNLQLTAGLIHRLSSMHQFSSDGSPDRKEKDLPFYDEFVEKQLLAGNISTRHFTVTLLSVNLTIPAADHIHAGSLPNSTTSSSENMLLKLQSTTKTRDDQSFQPALVISINRMEIHRNNPMYPTELTKLIIANAEFPASKSMLHHAFNNTVIQVFNIEMYISHTIPESALINIMPSVSAILSVKDCILPDTWKNETLKRTEVHLEVPSISLSLTKAQFLLLSHLFASWSTMWMQNKILPVLPTTVIASTLDFHSNNSQSELELDMSNIDIQCCNTSVVMTTTSSVGTISATIKSKGATRLPDSEEKRTAVTQIIKGPCDTKEIYKGTLFNNSTYHEDEVENVGPVISLTLQLPRYMEKKDIKSFQGYLHNTEASNVVLLQAKGISVCCDPLLYSWLAYQPSASSSSGMRKVEKDRRIRQASLVRTPSIGTPRKKSYARGSISSPSKGKVPQERSTESKLENTDGLTFEAWLFEKLPLITSFAVQVDIQSTLIFVPESPISQAPHVSSIAQNFAYQSWKGKSAFPSTLVVCLPSLEIFSASHIKVSFRPSLPVHLCKQTAKDSIKHDTLPWTMSAKNLAVYSVHLQSNHFDKTASPVCYYIVSPLSCTAVLASAKTSTPSSPTNLSLLLRSGSRAHEGTSRRESQKSPMLGFCIHADFEPLIVSTSRKQIKLLANLLESFFLAVVSPSSRSIEFCPPIPDSTSQRRMSVTSSSSTVEHIEKESVLSPSESSFSFTQIHQSLQDVKVSLWLQWTLPRFIVKLYNNMPSGSIPVCVTMDLEDLTAFIDYQETHLQMQYKVGAFNITHTMKRDSTWLPGPFGGILLSCKDILTYKNPPLVTSQRIPSTANQHEGPASGPHGFFNITYNRSSLHLKRKHSYSQKSGKEPSIEECLKIQHEVCLSVQPFDVVLWSPIIVAGIDVFDASLLCKFKFPSRENSKPFFDVDKEAKDGNDNVTLSVCLLPLLFMNMRDIRLFLPCSEITQIASSSESLHEDLVIVHLSAVTATPHPENPIGRTVLNEDLYEKFKKFGRSSRHALGYEVHEIQYQMVFSGFGVWTTKWKELCGNLNKQGDVGSSPLMDQNPALEWNTQLWRSAKEVHVSPVLTGSDFKIVIAPATTMERTVADARNTSKSFTDSIPVCGCSMELNLVTNVDIFLSKCQMQLLRTLTLENVDAFYSCELMSSLSQGILGNADFKIASQDGDHIDSGLGSTHTDPVKPSQKAIPFEAFLAARNITISMYLQRALKCRRNQHGLTVPAKEESPVYALSTKPVLQIGFLQPSVTYKDHALGPHLKLWCFDMSVLGSLAQVQHQGWLPKSLPEFSDYSIDCFSTGSGLPDPHTGIMPPLLTVDARNLTNGAMNASLDLGRPIHLSFNPDMVLEITRFFDDFIVHQSVSSAPTPPHKSPQEASTENYSALKFCNLTTHDISLELSLTTRDDCPKVLLGMTGGRGSIRIKCDEQGIFQRLDGNVETEGMEMSFLAYAQSFYLVRPFILKCEFEIISSPHSLTPIIPSLPQICSRVSIGLLRLEFGQQHMNCIAALSKALQEFSSVHSSSANTEEMQVVMTNKQIDIKNDNDKVVGLTSVRAEADLGLDEQDVDNTYGKNDVKEQDLDGVKQTFDDLRAGPFKYVMVSGEVGLHHPESYEILFTTDTRERPPTMVWRYPEPRALSSVEVLPLPFTSPVLVNTLNMGDELRVPCVLSYWDTLQKCYIVYKGFYISETSSCKISLPDPLRSDPATVIVAKEWQMIVDASFEIDYSEDQSLVDEDSGSSYSSPYRSLISATSLAASVKVDSVFSPSLIPAVLAQVSISMFQIKLLHHNQYSHQVLPKHLAGYTIDSSVPTEQEFCTLTIEGLSGVTKHLGGGNAVTLCSYEWNCHFELLDFGDLTYTTLVSPFSISVTTAFHKKGREAIKTADQRSVCLEAGVDIGNIEGVVTQSTVHTLALAVDSWTRDDKRKNETTLLCHYIICNDTNEAIRLGQVDTDESILLSSKHLLPYSWRVAQSLKAEPSLHVCFEREGDWRWSEPFDVDSVGISSRTIHHKLHSATLLIDVRSLSGVQKQVIFRGGLQIESRLSTGVDLQILKSPDLGSPHKEKASFQIHEDISLAPVTTLPSYIVSHAGLLGMRIRIPNTTTWSEALPLDNVGGDAKAQHLIVKLLGVKTFQTFYLWYSLEKTMFEQIQISLSPLFIMRSHLPDPILLNIFSSKTNSEASLEMIGRGHEEQLLHLPPNTWHHLTFQFDKCSKMSDPSVPLNSTLIDLANKVNPNMCDKVDIPLNTLWPYCGTILKEKDEISSVSAAHSPFVRYVVSRGNDKDANSYQKRAEISPKVSPFPDVELQCRVIKKWHHLNTLLVDVTPWCLLINKTVSTIFIKDFEDKGEIQMPSGQTIAPFKFKGKIQFGILVTGSSTISWSKPLSLPISNDEMKDLSAKEPNTPDESNHATINIAHISTSSRPVAVVWTMTSQTRHGVRVISVQEKFGFVNSTGKPLLVLPVLAAKVKKIPSDVLDIERAIQLPIDSKIKLPVAYWDIALTSSVVIDKEEVASVDDTFPVAFFALGEQKFQSNIENQDDNSIKLHTESLSSQWSQVFLMNSDLPRSAIAIPVRDSRTTIPLVMTPNIVSGITNIVVANDSSPRLIFYNDCPFTLQFGQATPPQSPSYQKGSLDKVIVVEQLEPFYEVPKIPALGMTHYELTIMREWFKTSSEFQEIPNIHIQALYDVTVAEISEGAEGRISHGQTTEVPQGWSHGFDINSKGHFVVNLPGRGRVIVFVSKSRLCTAVRIQIYDKDAVAMELPSNEVLSPSFDVAMKISKLEISLIDARNQRKPSEVLRTAILGINLCNSPLIEHSDGNSVFSELSLTLNSFQLDNQLEGELFQFPVVILANESFPKLSNASSQRKPRVGTCLKPFLSIKIKYEPNMEKTFLHSVLVSCEPITVFLEDTLIYRMALLAESFLPPAQEYDLLADSSFLETTLLLNECSSILNPLVIGKFDIEPVTIHLTLHASVKLFIGMDDTSLSLGHFHMSPVYAPTSAFAQKVLFHYMSSVMFKIGWVVGSLELLGNPAGLIRNFSQGLSDFFFLPYDGLTRGPGAFVSGMSQGVSSLVRHVSAGALTSVTNLASGISRNLDRMCMDEDHLRLLEEQRCRRPTRLMAGVTQGLSGFGLSLLGAVAGVVDQPIQGIQRANDVKEAAYGALTGVGRGLLGVVTKPIGGAMELVSQTGQGILLEAGLSHLPSRLHTVEDGLVIESRNSLLKYSWKVLQLKTNANILCVDVTVVNTVGHDYSGALLLTNNMIYITDTDTDAIQQSFHLRNTVLQKDECDNRTIIVTSVLQANSFDDYASDNPEPTGDPERMEQFLRDAQMFAQVSQADSSTDHSAESIITSNLKLIIDPILRDSVISRFTTAKYKVMV